MHIAAVGTFQKRALMFLLHFLNPTAPPPPVPIPCPALSFPVDLHPSSRATCLSTCCLRCMLVYINISSSLPVCLSLSHTLSHNISLCLSLFPPLTYTIQYYSAHVPQMLSRNIVCLLQVSLPMISFPQLLPLSRTPRARGCR